MRIGDALNALRHAILYLGIPIACFGQAQINSGDITGTVTDASGGRLASARIAATEVSRGVTRSAQTDTSGDYRLSLLPPGLYRVRVEAPGFAATVVENVEVRVGDTVVLPIRMEVSQVATEISVTAEAPVVDSERTQQASTIQWQQIRNLPINRRNYLDYALLTPGVVETNDIVDGTDFRVVQAPHSGLSFGGSNGRGNAFAVDGVENYVNSGGVRPSVSQEAVAEFQINRNSFSAEFGGGFGGAINIITRSGTNEAHGNLFGFLRHRTIQARNYFDPNPDGSAFTRSQAGATFGAPIARDKTFVFAAFERLDRHETSFVPILQDRSAFARLTPSQQQLADFFVASGSPQLGGLAAAARQALTPSNYPRTVELFDRNGGNFPFSEDSTQVSLRVDHRFTDNHNVFLRGNFTDNYSENAQLGALVAFNRGRNIFQRDATFVLNDTYVISSNWISETRAMFGHYTIDVTTIDKLGPQIDISGFGLFGREIFLPSKTIERHWQFMQNFSYASGRHNLRFGADINPVRDNVFSETFFSGRFSFGENVPLGLVLNSVAGDPNFTTSLGRTLAALGQQRLIPNLSAPLNSLQAFNLGLPTFYQQGFGNPNWTGWTKRYNLFVQDTFR
ncbi:MAG: carboxypeptidase regulatory-like domain-containing protein, partial [Bryobacteraceae bacterium]